MLLPETIEALKPLRTAHEAARARTLELREKLAQAEHLVATADEGAELVQGLERDRQRIVGDAFIAEAKADTKAIDKLIAEAVAARDKRKADAAAAAAAAPMLRKMLDEAEDAERSAGVELHKVARQALSEAMDVQRSRLHELADQVIEVIADMVAIGSAVDGLAHRLTGKDAHQSNLAWGLAKHTEMLTRSSPNRAPGELHPHVWQLAPGRTREVISELLTHGVDVNGRSMAAPKAPDVATEPRAPQTFFLQPDGSRVPLMQGLGMPVPTAAGG